MKTAKPGIDLIKQFEGFRAKAYLCPANVWTIGYGHTKTVKTEMIISESQAEELLKIDLADAERAVNRTNLTLTQNQFDALVSFVFNVGSGNFANSTLLKRLNEKADKREITTQFNRWIFGKNKVKLPGLVRRRAAEAELFCK
jgi:lysozyme